MQKLLSFTFILLFIALSAISQDGPAPEQDGAIILASATIHVGNGEVIENGFIRFDKGKITHVGKMATMKKLAGKVMDASGKHIYPGLIGMNSTLGLVEVGAVRASRDFREVGAFNPNVRSIIAYNTDSKITPTIRSNGVLMAEIVPRGGIISGTSSVVQLDAWNWEDAAYKTDNGIHLNWPALMHRAGWWAEPKPDKKNDMYKKNLDDIRKFFTEAKAYSQADPEIKDLRMEAMKGIFSGEKTLFVHANGVKEITSAIHFVRDFSILKMAIVGGRDAWMITDLLKENNIAIVLNRVHGLPSNRHDDIDLPYKTPYLLQQAGILYCLNYAGDMEVMGLRNLPFTAGTAAAYGLSKEEALMAITLNAAKILGIDKTTGSLEAGKDATLFISTGDALDMLANNVEMAFIQGRKIDLNNHQKALYEKFRKKYEGG